MAASKPILSLYTAGTPNGQKVSITLEELGLEYETTHVDITKGTQKEEWYLKINPNGRIPAILDKTERKDGMKVFEGAAIMLYLCQRYDREGKISYEFDSERYWETVEWLTWMQSGIGPMQGQANHFYRYAPEKIEYAIKRYQTETKRLYQVLEDRLKGKTSNSSSCPWIVGDKFTIVDIACFSWVNWAEWAGISLEPFPEMQKWLDRINERPAVKRGLDVPEPFKMKEKMKSPEGEEEYAKIHSNWVMEGQKKDAEKHK